MLARRFKDDGREAIPLSASQLAARDSVAARIRSGDYKRIDVDCPLCGADAPIPVSAKDMYGLPMDVGVCGGCGGMYTTRRFSDADLARFYDGEYRALDRAAPLEESGFFDLQRAKGARIAEFLDAAGAAPPPDALVLEIGCGAGGILASFRERGHPVLGVDLGREYVEWGARAHGLDLRVGDLAAALHELNASGRTPGLVIYEQVLEHLPEPAGELRRLRDALGPGASVFVGVPGIRNIQRHYDADLLRYLQIPHLVHFERATLERLLAQAGFRLVAGDEIVMSVFTPANGVDQPPPRDPDVVIAYLRRLERRHRLNRVTTLPARAARGLRPWVGRVLGRGPKPS